jgi:integrase
MTAQTGIDGIGGEEASRECPDCHSKRIWRDGIRETRNVCVQRFLCRDCYYRFSESPSLSADSFNMAARQVCVTLRGAKNLATATEIKTVAGDLNPDIKGRIIEYLWHLKKQGRRPNTQLAHHKVLHRLAKHGANLFDPESVKETIANENVGESTKLQCVGIYTVFAQYFKLSWTPPIYKPIRKIPFIPTETEIDQLTAGFRKRLATFLQILKETGARCGEVWKLKWTDLNGNILTINNPEKNSLPRQLKISDRLVTMLQSLPKKDKRIFGPSENLNNFRGNYAKKRRTIARTLCNPRIERITFHTFRHFCATMLYAKCKNILLVQQRLGHKSIDNTIIYTQLINFESDEYHTATATTTKEAENLVQAGFEYICTTTENIMLFRKRK